MYRNARQRPSEPAVCSTIRRNIEDFSRTIREMELNIARENEEISQARAKLRSTARDYAELVQEMKGLPELPGPDLNPRARGKLRIILRLLRRLGQIADAVSILNGARRAFIVERARQHLMTVQRETDEAIAEAETRRNEFQATMDRRSRQTRLQFNAFQDYGCNGDPERSVVYTVSRRR
jgi:DNA repair exonuclease SbcCD ATPase subunit